MRTALVLAVVVTYVGGCGESDDGFTSTSVGETARERISQEGESVLPASASDFYYWDQGFLSDHTTFWSFRCPTEEECRAASHSIELKDWVTPSFVFIQKGPEYFGGQYKTEKWDLSTIKNGCFALDVDYQDERYSLLQFTAIDYETQRVYRMRWYGDSLTSALGKLGYRDSMVVSEPTED